MRLIGMQQTGGRVLRIALDGRVVYAADLATLSGAVCDETRGAPLGGAKVELVGTPYSATADGAGRFTLTGTMDGEYQVTFAHPRLDSLAYAPEPMPVSPRPGHITSLRLRIPPESVIVAGLCADTAAPPDSYLLHGTVRENETKAPVFGAEVRASWQEIRGWAPGMPLGVEGRLRPFVLRERGVAAVTDSLGTYLLCWVPSGRRVTVTVARDGRGGRAASLVFEKEGVWVGDAWTPYNGRIWQHDLTLTQGLTRRAAIIGVATDSLSGVPLAHAVVSLAGTDISGVSDATGRFSLNGVGPGTHTLVVQRMGYDLLELVVTVASADTVRIATGKVALKSIR